MVFRDGINPVFHTIYGTTCYSKYMNRRVAVRPIIVHEGKLLCVRLNQYKKENTISSDNWCTAGGGVDDGESITDALHREMLEETGIAPVIGNLLYFQQFIDNDVEHLEFFFHVTNAEDYLNIDLGKTTHGVAEIAEIAFIDAAAHTVLPTFLSSERFIDLESAPAKVFSYL
jgi:ADP-ribose pyrophosphatase YjhB (NUDIX family)